MSKNVTISFIETQYSDPGKSWLIERVIGDGCMGSYTPVADSVTPNGFSNTPPVWSGVTHSDTPISVVGHPTTGDINYTYRLTVWDAIDSGYGGFTYDMWQGTFSLLIIADAKAGVVPVVVEGEGGGGTPALPWPATGQRVPFHL